MCSLASCLSHRGSSHSKRSSSSNSSRKKKKKKSSLKRRRFVEAEKREKESSFRRRWRKICTVYRKKIKRARVWMRPGEGCDLYRKWMVDILIWQIIRIIILIIFLCFILYYFGILVYKRRKNYVAPNADKWCFIVSMWFSLNLKG